MSDPKLFSCDLAPKYDGLWSGKFAAQDVVDGDGKRTISVELREECDLTTSALADEVSHVTTQAVESAYLMVACCRLILELQPGCKTSGKKVVSGFMSGLESHLSDLPSDRYGALHDAHRYEPVEQSFDSAGMTPERIEAAMATSSLGGFLTRDH